MSIAHHPPDTTLLAYSSGALSEALGLVVDVHMDACAVCRNDILRWEAVGGAYLASVPEAAMDDGALAKVLGRLDPHDQHATAPVPVSRGKGSRLSGRFHPRRRISLAPGIWVAPLLRDRASGSRAILIGVTPGRGLPRHDHDGTEMTCVLEGEFVDAGRTYRRGDFLEVDEHHEHQPRVAGADECVCVIAWSAPPRVEGVLGWLARRFL